MAATAEQRLPATTASRDAGCVACGGPLCDAEPLGAVALAGCRRCGSRTALPRPSLAETAALHDSDEYYAKEYFDARRGRDLVTERRFRRVLALLEQIRPDLPLRGRRLLDVGCDTGDFAAAAARIAGVRPYGVDVARRPLEAARAAGVEVACGDLSQAPEKFGDFALVTVLDVIEHVPDPVALLREVRGRLAPGGVVYLETPNWRSSVYVAGRVLARTLRGRPRRPLARLFPPEHVQYFTPEGLRQAAARAELRPLVLFTQQLRRDALAGGPALGAAIALLQAPDRLLRRRILLSGLFEPDERRR